MSLIDLIMLDPETVGELVIAGAVLAFYRFAY